MAPVTKVSSGDEVWAVVAVEDRRNTAGMPARVLFAPGHSDGEGSRERGRFLKAESIADNRATVVILNRRESGLGRLACFIEQQDVEGGMIGLPHRVGVKRLSPVDQTGLFLWTVRDTATYESLLQFKPDGIATDIITQQINYPLDK